MAAFSLASIRNQIITSLHGRRLGFDVNDQLVGSKGMRLPITAATSDTTGTNLPNYGIVELVSSTDDTWVLSDPVPGGSVTIKCASTSTGTFTITGDNATFRSSASSTGGSVTITGNVSAGVFTGESTSVWAITANRVGASIAVNT